MYDLDVIMHYGEVRMDSYHLLKFINLFGLYLVISLLSSKRINHHHHQNVVTNI